MRSRARALFALLGFGFAALGAAAADSAEKENRAMKITTNAFAHNDAIPAKYTCDGADVSAPLVWSGVPAGTKSFILIVDDPDAPDPAAPKTTWVHWVLYNIPTSATSLPEAV